VQTFTRLAVEHNYEVLLSSVPLDSGLPDVVARKMMKTIQLAMKNGKTDEPKCKQPDDRTNTLGEQQGRF